MIRTRFSPSPTGHLHIGNARTALFSSLFAKKNNGVFLIRIEDTDAARSDEKYIDSLQLDLHWLGVGWQEGFDVGGPLGPYKQSARKEIYDKYYQQLEDSEIAYPCFCSEQELAVHRKLQLSRGIAPRYSGKCKKLTNDEIQKLINEGKKPALRFKVPNDVSVEFVDGVKGVQRFASDDIGDFIIRRQDGSASFMFCNAIDDSLMKITHVIRGEDHLTNTPRQLLILQALNLTAPTYVHLSLIAGSDGGSLSKRLGSLGLRDLREEGFLACAVLNYLGRLGHSLDTNNLLNYSELADHFNLEKLSRAPARFDKDQLLHWQKESVLKLSFTELEKWLGNERLRRVPSGKKQLFMEMIQQNSLFPQDADKWIHILFTDEWSPDDAVSLVLKETDKDFFVAIAKEIQNGQDLKTALNKIKDVFNIQGKKLFLPVRIALTGESHGPELVHIAELLGAEAMAERFLKAAEYAREAC